MVNLTFHYPHIPYAGTDISLPTGATGYEANSVHAGARAKIYYASASSTSSAWSWDYGSTIAPDYLIIAHADYLTKRDSASISYTVRGASDSGFVTGTNYSGTISTSNLIGTTASDFYVSLTTAAYRYWKVTLTTTDTFKHSVSKIYLGNALDLGRDPTYSSLIRRGGLEQNWQTKYSLQLEYQGIPNATRETFWNTIIAKSDIKQIFLRDSGDAILQGYELLHCRLLDAEITSIGLNNSSFTLRFEEIIG